MTTVNLGNVRGQKGEKGTDGLTTAVQLGSTKKVHVNGTIAFTADEIATAHTHTGYAPTAHEHAIANVTGLQAELNKTVSEDELAVKRQGGGVVTENGTSYTNTANSTGSFAGGSNADIQIYSENAFAYGNKVEIMTDSKESVILGGRENKIFIGEGNTIIGGTLHEIGEECEPDERAGNVVIGGVGGSIRAIGTEMEVTPYSSSQCTVINGQSSKVWNANGCGSFSSTFGTIVNKEMVEGDTPLVIPNNEYISGSVMLGGSLNDVNGSYSATLGGQGLIANGRQVVMGVYNKEFDSKSALIIGKGYYDSNPTTLHRSNAFRVTADGHVYGCFYFAASGADYAEYFEWKDGNPNNEDRRGLFVTLDGDKIKIANETDDYILGVISGNPCVLGNSHEDQWSGMYEYDIFGSPIYEIISYEQEVIPGKKENLKRKVQKINSEFDNTQKYIPRSERKEWSPVGLHGQLVTIDDGTCQVNSYCKPSANGIATASETGYRVLKRLDETHISVLIK